MLALAACGPKPEAGGTTTALDEGAPQEPADADRDDGDAGGSGAMPGAITAVDAARGGGALPADSYGPTAYDLAQARGDRAGKRRAEDLGDAAGTAVPADDTAGAGAATPAATGEGSISPPPPALPPAPPPPIIVPRP
jgi:hypothetical protein